MAKAELRKMLYMIELPMISPGLGKTQSQEELNMQYNIMIELPIVFQGYKLKLRND